jgi:lysophospholipase L1-like esterase
VKRRRVRLLFALVPALVLLAAGEAASRLVPYRALLDRFGYAILDEPALRLQEVNLYDGLVLDPYNGYRAADRPDPNSRRPPRLPVPPKRPGEVRIVCLGNSTTYDTSLPEERSWPRRLQEMLGAWAPAGTRFEVYNGGVAGYSAQQAKRLYQSRLVQIDPDVILWREPTRCADAVELPPPRSLAALRTIRFLYGSRLVYMASVGYRLLRHPGPEALHLLPENVPSGYVADVFPAFVRWCRDRGAKAFVGVEEVFLKSDADLTLHGSAKDFRARGLPYVPCLDAFRAHPGGPRDLFVDHCHFKDAGAVLQASLISEWLRGHWPAVVEPGFQPEMAQRFR